MSRNNHDVNVPIQITLDEKARSLILLYSHNKEYQLTYEFLRVFSPSAEVVGHGPGQRVNPVGKEHVKIDSVEPVGNYAVKIAFSDGHDTGIYSWKYFKWLFVNRDNFWTKYREETANDVRVGRGNKSTTGHRVKVTKERI